jgi:hypothetical protein
MSTPAQPLFDMSKATPIGQATGAPLFDMSKATAIDNTNIEPGFQTSKSGRKLSIPNAIHLDPQAIQEANKIAAKAAISGVGAFAGGELAGPAAGLFARAGASGLGAAGGNTVGRGVIGQNPISKEGLEESGMVGATTTGADLFFGALPLLGKTKLGRMLVNESIGATAKDVTFGNPAKAIADINTPFTGNIEKLKAALRAGQSLDQAEIAAGGRLGAISQKIQTLTPQLESAVNAAKTTVKSSDVIDKPLTDALNKVLNNKAMTDADKMTIMGQLGDLQKTLHQNSPGPDLTMQQVLQIKRDIGNEVGNWLVEPRNEVQEAYRSVYGTAKDALHNGVPGAAKLDEQLTDSISAKNAIEKLARNQEVGRGVGPTRANMGINWLGKLETILGNVLPGMANTSKGVQQFGTPGAAAISGGASIGDQLRSKIGTP